MVYLWFVDWWSTTTELSQLHFFNISFVHISFVNISFANTANPPLIGFRCLIAVEYGISL